LDELDRELNNGERCLQTNSAVLDSHGQLPKDHLSVGAADKGTEQLFSGRRVQSPRRLPITGAISDEDRLISRSTDAGLEEDGDKF
jgi:hypothetical protein